MEKPTNNVCEADAHAQSVGRLVTVLRTHLNSGLSDEEAGARLARYGPNELQERARPTFWRLLLDQFNNFLVIILLASAIISLILGEYLDASAIMAIVVLNAVLGVVQESKAEEALAALKKLAAPEAKVIRDGHQTTIPARELVLGDLVVLEDVVHTLRNRRHAPLAVGLFLAMVVAAATGLLSISVAALSTAFLMIVSGCIRLRLAYRAVDVKVLLLIIGTLAMGAAMTKTGAADLYATEGCGTAMALDQSRGTGWSADVDGAPSVTIELPRTIDVTRIGLDPTPVCGDPPAAGAAQLSRRRVGAVDQTAIRNKLPHVGEPPDVVDLVHQR